jgi:hypothetical protein
VSDLRPTIDHIRALVDTYSADHHPLPELIQMRRELSVFLFRLTAFVKETYGAKLHRNILRKYAYYREIIVAMDKDKKALGKPRAMNAYEVETEAMDGVLQAKKAEAEADAAWEEVRHIIDLGKQVLQSMQQEISDLKIEKSNPSYQNTGA